MSGVTNVRYTESCCVRNLFISILVAVFLCGTASARLQFNEEQHEILVSGSYKEKGQLIDEMSSMPAADVLPVFKMLVSSELFYQKSDKQLFVVTKAGENYHIENYVTGEAQTLDSKNPVLKN